MGLKSTPKNSSAFQGLAADFSRTKVKSDEECGAILQKIKNSLLKNEA